MRATPTTTPQPTFAWEFLDEIADWSMRVAALIALGGLILLRQPSFALGCLAGAGTTAALVRYAAKLGMRGESYDSKPAILLVAGRLVVVSLVLAASFFMPALLDLTGTIVGIVTFDLTLAVAGSYIALRRGFGGIGEGR